MAPRQFSPSKVSTSAAHKPNIKRSAQPARDAEPLQRQAQAALAAPQLSSPDGVLALQSMAGNRAVQRLLAGDPGSGSGAVQRQASPGSLAGGPLDAHTQAEIQQSRGGGQRLDPHTGAQMGAALGADFNRVRVHTDAKADRLSRSLNARAFTLGSDIYFRQGQYNPKSSSGQRLLAHELTHVVQQGGGRSAVQTSLEVGPAGDRYEQEADAVASRVMRHLSAAPPGQPVEAVRGRPPAISRAYARPVLQRAMGWEFETGYEIEKKQGNGFVPLSKMEVIKDYGGGLKMTADTTSRGTSVIEMVLDPPVQEHQPDKMAKALKKFTKIGQALHAIRDKQGNAPPRKLSKVKGLSAPSKYQITKAPFMGFEGNPQITGGVRFDQLYKFLEHAATAPQQNDAHKDAKKALSGGLGSSKDTASLTDTDTAVGNINGSKELKGMVALLAMYLRYGDAGQGKDMFNYAKLLGDTFMARTDFGTMFSKLPDEEYNRFTHDPRSFVTLVLNAAGMPGTGSKKVYERGIRKSYDPHSADYNVDLTTQIPKLAITREDWLLGITMGVDRLSSSNLPELKNELEGLGALGSRTDRVGDEIVPKAKKQPRGGKGIILEMRKLKTNMFYTEFVPTAQKIFDYLVALNEDKTGNI